MDITVVIPTYNRYTLLKRALRSVYIQSHPPQEVIVVDDGSKDATAHIQKDFPDIIYIYQKNRGVSSARNRGILEAKNEWIAFLDSDDEWQREKLLTQVSFHRDNPDILMSYTDEIWIRNGVEKTVPKKFQKIGKDIFKENLSYCNIAPSSVMIHKTLLQKVGLFDESLKVCEDYDLWLKIVCKDSIGYIDKKLIRKHAGHDEQLGFSKDIQLWQVQSLEHLFECCEERREEIREELMKKYSLLLKASVKYGRISQTNFYTTKLTSLKVTSLTI